MVSGAESSSPCSPPRASQTSPHVRTMQRYLIRRLGRTIFALWGVSTIVFVVLRLSGDPAVLLLPQEASVEDVMRLRQDLGLDDPLLLQYLRFLGNSAVGNFGES